MDQNSLFVKWCYSNLLGRDADQDGLHHYLGLFKSGATLSQVFFDILSSPECSFSCINNKELATFLKPYFPELKLNIYKKYKRLFFRVRQRNMICNYISFKYLSEYVDNSKNIMPRSFSEIESVVWRMNDKINFLSAMVEARQNSMGEPAKGEIITKNFKGLKFSIVVNTYNRAHTIKSTLESLRRLRYSDYEVIIVNGPSTDGTDSILENYKDKYKITSCPEANLSKSRNVGISMSSGDVVCFIDDDAVPEPNWLDNIAIAYKNDPCLAAVGGFIRDNTGFSYQAKYILCDYFGDSLGFETFDDVDLELSKGTNYYLSPTGTNCTFRKDVLIAVGGFDEEYVYFLDETDVVSRMVEAGYNTKIVEGSEIHHKFASSHLRDSNKIPKDIYYSVRSKAYFLIRNALHKSHLNSIMDYLCDYRKNLRKDYDWYYDNNLIDENHWKTLHNGIDLGLHDGLFDALSGDRKLINHDKNYSNEFKSVVSMFKKESLKICFLVDEFPPDLVGGIGKWTYILAKGLAEKGHEVTVITRSVLEHPVVDYADGFFIHRLPIRHYSSNVADLPKLGDLPSTIKDVAYTFYEEVERLNKIRGVDVVSSPIWDVIGCAVVMSNKYPTVVSLHTNYKMALPFKKEWVGSYKLNHVDKVLVAEQEVLNYCSSIMANSKAITSDSVDSLFDLKDKIFIVPHAVECQSTNCSVAGDDGVIDILFVGRFEYRKGIDILLDCIPMVLEKNKNVFFHLVGRDSEPYNQSASVEDWFCHGYRSEEWFSNVLFYGEVDEDTKNSLYSKCDIFVAPSRYESFGLIFLEAMSFGLPCIGLNVGGVPEVVKSGSDGLLIDGESPSDLAAAIIKLVDSEELRLSFSRNGLQKSLLCFNLDSMISGAVNCYGEAIGKYKTMSL